MARLTRERAVQEIRTRRAQMRSIGKLRRRRRPPRQRQPDAIRTSYYGFLLRLLERARELVRKHVVPALPGLVAQADAARPREDGAELRLDEVADSLNRLLDLVTDEWFAEWPNESLAQLAAAIANRTSAFQLDQLSRQFKAVLGFDLLKYEPWLAPRIRAFTTENVALIKSIASDHFADLEKRVAAGLSNGLRWEELAGVIEDRYGVAEGRARLVARDQVGKLFGSLNETRQKQLGVGAFVWRTMKDNRVRDTHEDLEGERYEWDGKLPEGRGGEPIIPGEEINCRCWAEPDFNSLLADVEERPDFTVIEGGSDDREDAQETSMLRRDATIPWERVPWGPDGMLRGSLGVERADMPQIRAPFVPAFLDEMRGVGVAVARRARQVGVLHPSQGSIHIENVLRLLEELPDADLRRPVIVSADLYLLDGHHRWAALFTKGSDELIETYEVGLPIDALLARARGFAHVEHTDGWEDVPRDEGGKWTGGGGGAKSSSATLALVEKLNKLYEAKWAATSPGVKAALTKKIKALEAEAIATKATSQAKAAPAAPAGMPPGAVPLSSMMPGAQPVASPPKLSPAQKAAATKKAKAEAAAAKAKEEAKAAEQALAAAKAAADLEAKKAAEVAAVDAKIASLVAAKAQATSPGVKAAITKKVNALKAQKATMQVTPEQAAAAAAVQASAAAHQHGEEAVGKGAAAPAKPATTGEFGPFHVQGTSGVDRSKSTGTPTQVEKVAVTRAQVHAYLGYTDAGKYYSAMRKDSEAWRSALPSEQKGAVSYYQASGYDPMNGGLRKSAVGDSSTSDRVRDLTKALDAAPALAHDTVVWRGFHYSELAQDPIGFLAKNGGVYQDKGFVSTSVHSSKAGGFAGWDVKSSVLVRVRVPKGTKTAYLTGTKGPYEYEHVLQRDASFRVTGVYKTSDNMVVLDAVYEGSNPVGLTKRGSKADAAAARSMSRASKFVWNEGDVTWSHG